MSGIGDAAKLQEESTEEVRFKVAMMAEWAFSEKTKEQRVSQDQRPAHIKSCLC